MHDAAATLALTAEPYISARDHLPLLLCGMSIKTAEGCRTHRLQNPQMDDCWGCAFRTVVLLAKKAERLSMLGNSCASQLVIITAMIILCIG